MILNEEFLRKQQSSAHSRFDNRKTAELLRSRMNNSKGLAYVATGNIPDSK